MSGIFSSPSEPANLNDGIDNQQIGLFATLLAMMIAAFHLLSRAGFAMDGPLFAYLVGFAAFLFLAPEGITRRFTTLSRLPGWIKAPPIGAGFILLLFSLIGFLWPAIGPGVLTLAALAGFLLLAMQVFNLFTRQPRPASIIFLVSTACFGIWLAVANFHFPLYIEQLIFPGGTMDTLSHAAFANMIDTYGHPSTGLHGAPFIPYHVGSHWMMNNLSHLFGIPVLRAYVTLFPIVILPFLFFTMLHFIKACRGALSAGPLSPLFSDKWFLLLFWVSHAGIIPVLNGLKNPLGLYWGNNWVPSLFSESYTFSLCFTFLLLTQLVLIFSQPHAKDNSSPFPKAFLLLALPLQFILIGLLKISQLFLLCFAYAYLYFRLQLFRSLFANLLTGVLVVVSYLTYSYGRPLEPTVWNAFSFLRENFPPWLVPLFFIFNLAWLLLYVYFRLQGPSLKINAIFPTRRYRLIDVELAVFLFAIGLIPLLTLDIAGRSGGFFIDFPVRLFIALALAAVPIGLRDLSFSRFPVKAIAGGLIVLMVSVGVYNTGYKLQQNLQQNLAFRSRILTHPNFVSERTQQRRIMNRWADYQPTPQTLGVLPDYIEKTWTYWVIVPGESLYRHPNWQTISYLMGLDHMPTSQKKELAVFIPRDNQAFWGMRQCQAMPFMIPALTGMAAIRGLPSTQCSAARLTKQYYGGYPLAKWENDTATSKPLPQESLCRMAQDTGIRHIYRIQAFQPKPQSDIVTCKSF